MVDSTKVRIDTEEPKARKAAWHEVRSEHRDITRDPREDEDWFRRLPPQAKEEFREVWRVRGGKENHWLERSAVMRNRVFFEAMLVVAVPVTLGSLLQGLAAPIVWAIPCGLATGAVWRRVEAGQILSGLIGMVGTGLAMMLGGGFVGPGGFFCTAFGCFLSGLLGAVTGMRRELTHREESV